MARFSIIWMFIFVISFMPHSTTATTNDRFGLNLDEKAQLEYRLYPFAGDNAYRVLQSNQGVETVATNLQIKIPICKDMIIQKIGVNKNGMININDDLVLAVYNTSLIYHVYNTYIFWESYDNTSSNLLKRATTDVKETFKDTGTFWTSSIYIFTYYKIYTGYEELTFQAALITDEKRTFLRYAYMKTDPRESVQVGYFLGEDCNETNRTKVALENQKGNHGEIGVSIYELTFNDTNECLVDPYPCHTNAYCNNTVGSFSCACKSGYTGNGFTCSDINECLSDPYPCHTNADCNNTVGDFSCACKSGYTGNGLTCNDINECLSDPYPCHTNADCNNTVGNFSCACKSGYTGNGLTCNASATMQSAATTPSKANANLSCLVYFTLFLLSFIKDFDI